MSILSGCTPEQIVPAPASYEAGDQAWLGDEPSRVLKWDPAQVEWATRKLGRVPVSPADFAEAGVPDPYETVEGPRNRFVTVGLDILTKRLITAEATYPAWLPSAAGSGKVCMGVGSGTTADAIGDTDLTGASKTYKQLDNAYPTQSGGTITVQCTFTSAEANHAWNEYGLFVPANSSAAAVSASTSTKPSNTTMLNHKSNVGYGTKSSGEVWTWQYPLTLS